MIFQKNRQTKTIWSFEAKYLDDKLASTIVGEDFDALRIVYESGYGKKIAEFIAKLKSAKPADRTLPIMLDVPTQVRANIVADFAPREVLYGENVSISNKVHADAIAVVSEEWSQMFVNGATVYFGPGVVAAVVKSVEKDLVKVEIVQGGTLTPGMEIHVPTTRQAPLCDQFDLKDISLIFSQSIDYFVMPGFSSLDEIVKMREAVDKHCKIKPWFLLKLNSDLVHKELAALLPEVHGVLISRLELALFMEPAMIPIVTKEIIQLCNDQAKVCLTASEMLGSMRTNATPTRAEVSDVANAVGDGTDAVVLTEDVASGPHAVRAIRLMAKIVEDFELKRELTPNWVREEPLVQEEMDAVAYSAYRTAKRVGAKALVCLTKEGNTAVKLASYRTSIPILAVTFSRDVLRRLSIVRGVSGILLESDPVIDQVLPVVNDLLKRESWLRIGDRIVFVSVTLSSLSRNESNLFTVQSIS